MAFVEPTSSICGSRTEPVDTDVEARTGYEASKLARERYAEYHANHHEMNAAGLRFFWVYQGFGGNEAHEGEYANTVAQFADAIASGEAPELFGDGSQTRDFAHVSDVVRACELAADHGLTAVSNVGTQEAHSFNEMVAIINDALGTDLDPGYIECPFDGYVHDTMADPSKFHEATGWEPEVDFEEGVWLVCAPYVSFRSRSGDGACQDASTALPAATRNPMIAVISPTIPMATAPIWKASPDSRCAVRNRKTVVTKPTSASIRPKRPVSIPGLLDTV
jgi:UDP-glucose 4-epimerase